MMRALGSLSHFLFSEDIEHICQGGIRCDAAAVAFFLLYIYVFLFFRYFFLCCVFRFYHLNCSIYLNDKAIPFTYDRNNFIAKNKI